MLKCTILCPNVFLLGKQHSAVLPLTGYRPDPTMKSGQENNPRYLSYFHINLGSVRARV